MEILGGSKKKLKTKSISYEQSDMF